MLHKIIAEENDKVGIISLWLENNKPGDMEIQNQNERYLYRGPIETITLEGNEVIIKFRWLAKGEGFPPLPKKWVKDDDLNYRASLEIYTVNEIGNNRLSMFSHITGELVVFFPEDGSKLDPSKVEGL